MSASRARSPQSPAASTVTTAAATATAAGGESHAPRSIFARLGRLKSSRNIRYLTDFHISPAEPHRKYAAGDRVTGHVVLVVVKPVRITHLTATLHGVVRVSKGPQQSHDTTINSAEIKHTGSTPHARYQGNGVASLFRDEQVLSGDGKLEPGRYEFGFELLFPEKGLASSIDFERGTISYMITASLTRPISSSPIQTCERKIQFAELVDVGSIPPPQSRTIYLEPLTRKNKRRRPAANGKQNKTEAADILPSAAEADASRQHAQLTEGSLAIDDANQEVRPAPRSPSQNEALSEISGESVVSSSTGKSGRQRDQHSSARTTSSNGGQGKSRTSEEKEKTITARVQLLKGGCLPGDLLSVKISIQHIKRIKSLHGVIVTLYRQGRIDSAPPLELFTDLSKEEVRQLEKEEYYPKSKTGLGGLSLTSAGSCSVFRKDLSQAFSPLITDPTTHGSSVTATIKIPEDSFPTIKGVPGDMISFKYRVEVILDLGGRLASQLQSGQAKGGSVNVAGLTTRNPYEAGSSLVAMWNGSIVDTDQLRRQKGVIAVNFEVIVGNRDTSRERSRALSRSLSRSIQPDYFTEQEGNNKTLGEHRDSGWDGEGPFLDGESYPYESESPYPYPEEYPRHPTPDTTTRHYRQPYHTGTPMAPVYVPPPEVADESTLTEKQRIQRAEQRLLPSQPSAAADATSAGPSSSSAPIEEDIYEADEPVASPTTGNGFGSVDATPSAPTLDDLTPVATSNPAEDKQEMERQRLLAEASAPPEFPSDIDAGVGTSSAPGPLALEDLEPSAPVLNDEDDQGSRGGMIPRHLAPESHGAEQLPRYER